MERLKSAVVGDGLAQALAKAYFEAARAQVERTLAELHAKPIDLPPPVRAAILAHMAEWRDAFTHDGPLNPEAALAAVRKAGAKLAREVMDEDFREQMAIALPADEAA